MIVRSHARRLRLASAIPLTVSLLATAAMITYNRTYKAVTTDLYRDQVSEAQTVTKPSRSDGRQRRLPQVVLVGVNKGGTRALITYLDLHPDVVTAKPEVNYFGLYYDRGEEWYRSQMPLSRHGQLTMEKSPKYYETAEAPQRIHAMNASMKILLVVRDPVDRSVSQWLHVCGKARSIQEAGINASQCSTYEDSDFLKSDGDVDPNCTFIRRSSYAKFIENWTRLFRLGSQLHIVDGERLASDPVSELRDVETFLGLHPYFTQENFVFNEAIGFYCLRSNGRRMHCLGKTKGVKHPIVDPLLEAKLRKYFKPLNQRFYQIVGHDFRWR